jgi:DNA-binding MarR family transcriptional regulator
VKPAKPLPTQTEPPLAAKTTLSILRAAALLLEELEPVFAGHKTTAARFDVLDALKSLGRPARPVELKARLHLPAQTITGILDALEKKGLVRRKPNPTDRRSLLVELTVAGAATFERLCPPLVAIEQASMADLSESELHALVGMLETIEATIQARWRAG